MNSVPRFIAILGFLSACGYGYDDAGPARPAGADAGDDGDDDTAQPDADPAAPDATPSTASLALWCYGDGIADNQTQLIRYSMDDTGGMMAALPEGGELFNADDGAASGTYGAYSMSPDGRTIAMAADLEVAGRFDLYVGPIDGAPTQRVAMTADADVERVVWSPDGSRLAFRADLDVDGSSDIYVVDVDGTDAALRVSPARPGPADAAILDARDLAWAQDEDALLFTGDFTDDLHLELWRAEVGAGAGAPVALLDRAAIAATAAGQKGAIAIIRADAPVLFRARADADDHYRIKQIDDGEISTLANSELARDGGGIADVGTVGLSRDGSTLAFAADPLATAYEIYAMPADGSAAPTRLTDGSVAAGRNPEHNVPLAFDRDGQYVAFIADYATDGKNEPYAASLDGGGAIRLAAIAGATDQDAVALVWGERELFMVADHEANNDNELWRLSSVESDQVPAKVADVASGGDFFGCAVSEMAD